MKSIEQRTKQLGEIAEAVKKHVPEETVIQITKRETKYSPRKIESILKQCTPQDPCYWCAVKPLR